jgi:hypothetical protein
MASTCEPETLRLSWATALSTSAELNRLVSAAHRILTSVCMNLLDLLPIFEPGNWSTNPGDMPFFIITNSF